MLGFQASLFRFSHHVIRQVLYASVIHQNYKLHLDIKMLVIEINFEVNIQKNLV